MNGIGFEGLMLNDYYLVQHRVSCDQKRLDEKGLDGLRFKRGSGYSYFTWNSNSKQYKRLWQLMEKKKKKKKKKINKI